MKRTIYMFNPKIGVSQPLYTFTEDHDLDWYVTWKLSCSTREAYAMMDAFNKGIPFVEEFYPNIQYEVRLGD